MDPIRDKIVERIAEALKKDGIECDVLKTEKDWNHAAILFSVKINDDETVDLSTRHRGVDYALNLDFI